MLTEKIIFWNEGGFTAFLLANSLRKKINGEFYLTDEDLKDIDRIKLEYTIQNKKFKLDDLLDLLKRNGYKCSIFRNGDTNRLSNRIAGNIYATKL